MPDTDTDIRSAAEEPPAGESSGDALLANVPDELVTSVLEKLAVYYHSTRQGARPGESRLFITEKPDGTHDVEVFGSQLDYERVTIEQ